MDAIFKGDGNVLVLKVEKLYTDARSDRIQLTVAGGAEITTSVNSTIIIDQRNMDENEYKELLKKTTDSLISDTGKVTYYDPSTKETKTSNKRLRL